VARLTGAGVQVQAEFAFGKTGLSVSLPDGRDYTVVESRSAGPLADAAAAIAAALDRPIGSAPAPVP
jgi:hypothetical protein